MGRNSTLAEDLERHRTSQLFPGVSPVGRGPSGTFTGRSTSAGGVPFASSQRVRAQIAPILERRLGPALAQALARQAGRPGASTEGILRNLETMGGFEISRELTGLQLAADTGATVLPPKGPGFLESTIGGAIEGGVTTGSGIGAVTGGIGGAVKSLRGDRERDKAKKRDMQVKAAAAREASAEQFGQRAGELEPQAREQALVSGAGAQRSQNLEAMITATGLRDTGIGTLGSIAAGVQGPLEELSRTFELALGETRRAVAARLGAPIDAPRQKPDRLTQSLEALANVFLQKGSGEDEAALPSLFPEDAPITSEEVTEPGIF